MKSKSKNIIMVIISVTIGAFVLQQKLNFDDVNRTQKKQYLNKNRNEVVSETQKALPGESVHELESVKNSNLTSYLEPKSSGVGGSQPRASGTLSHIDLELIDLNIQSVGLSAETSKLLAGVAREKVLADRSIREIVAGRVKSIQTAFWASENGNANDQQLLELEQFKQELLEINRKAEQAGLAFEDSIRNLLTNEQQLTLENHEKEIVEEKMRLSLHSFVDVAISILPNVEAHQREFASTISEGVLTSGTEGYYKLGMTLQAADTSSPSFEIDNKVQLVAAAQLLGQVLTSEQLAVFDVTKLSSDF